MNLVKGKKYYVLQKGTEKEAIIFIGIFIGKKDDKLYFLQEQHKTIVRFNEHNYLFFNFTSRL